MSGFMNWQSR